MKKIILLILLTLSSLKTSVPSDYGLKIDFQKNYGAIADDYYSSVIEISDGGFVAVGYSVMEYEESAIIVKCDKDGNMLWQKIYNKSDSNTFKSVIETSNGEYVVVGESYIDEKEGQDAIIIKYDKNGNILWQKHYNEYHGDYGGYFSFRSVIETSDGEYLAVGEEINLIDNSDDAYYAILAKYDKNGNLLWKQDYEEIDNIEDEDYEEIYNIEDEDYEEIDNIEDEDYEEIDNIEDEDYEIGYIKCDFINSVIELSDGNYIAVGFSYYMRAHYNSYSKNTGIIAKYDKNGNILWQKSSDGSFDKVIETSDGGYLAIGVLDIEDKGYVAVIVKHDENGNILWKKHFNKYDYNSFKSIFMSFDSIIETSDGGYLAVGSSRLSEDSSGMSMIHDEIIILEYDKNGNILYQECNMNNSDNYESIIETSDGGYIVFGYRHIYKGYETIIKKYDKNRHQLWEKSSGIFIDNNAIIESIIETSDRGYLVVFSGAKDFMMVKFSLDKLFIDVLPVENGTYTIDDKDGLKVIRPVADDGYEVDKVIVKNSSGENVEVNKDDDGSYTFEMNDNVEVEIIFKENGGKNIIKKFIDNKMIIIIVSVCSIVLLGIVYILFRRSKRVK